MKRSHVVLNAGQVTAECESFIRTRGVSSGNCWTWTLEANKWLKCSRKCFAIIKDIFSRIIFTHSHFNKLMPSSWMRSWFESKITWVKIIEKEATIISSKFWFQIVRLDLRVTRWRLHTKTAALHRVQNKGSNVTNSSRLRCRLVK